MPNLDGCHVLDFFSQKLYMQMNNLKLYKIFMKGSYNDLFYSIEASFLGIKLQKQQVNE